MMLFKFFEWLQLWQHSKKYRNLFGWDGKPNRENLSNILKLYRTLLKNEYQVVFYDQGVGTLKKTSTWGRWKQKARHFMGLAFGYGLDRNVLKAYEFLVQNYQEQKIDTKFVRDDIFIFGFSRGAHTARVLAGLIYEIGILRPEQIHLSSAALIAYKQSTQTDAANLIQDEEAYEGEGMNFRRVTNSRTAAIKFLGVFDTVSSVLIPNANSYFPPLVMERLLRTQKNPAVKISDMPLRLMNGGVCFELTTGRKTKGLNLINTQLESRKNKMQKKCGLVDITVMLVAVTSAMIVDYLKFP